MFSKIVFALCVLIMLSRDFALIICISGVFFLGFTALFRKKMKALHKIVQERLGYARSFIQESTAGLLIIKVFGTEKKILQHSAKLQEDYYKAQMKRRTISIFANAGFGLAFDSAYLLALLIGANGILTNTMSYGTLTAILQLIGQIQQPFANISGLFPKYYAMIASAERLIEIEQIENEPPDERLPADELYSHMISITGNGLTFSYGRNEVLDGAEFVIEKGDFISITGLSGGGKSTLFLLLMGAYQPTDGALTLHTDLAEYPVGTATRKLFAYVPQGNYLFSGTLQENISFLSDTASEEEILYAAEMACIRTFIETLPEGLNTLIGERGLGLSEGQIQRIAIARALLSNAPVLLLDEATSALDEKTELRLLQNITSLKHKTCLLVTHRKAAIQFCNKQFSLKEGKITQMLREVNR
jgi:ATP-binding cassette subfamily B protein